MIYMIYGMIMVLGKVSVLVVGLVVVFVLFGFDFIFGLVILRGFLMVY